MKRQFILMIMAATIWLLISIYLSRFWITELSEIFSLPIAIFIITGIAYLPGFLSVNLLMTLVFIKYPSYKSVSNIPVTILIPTLNEKENIYHTLKSIKNQDYDGEIRVIIIDNGSSDQTINEVFQSQKDLNLNITLLKETRIGKHYALNTGLEQVFTPYLITVDADTCLHPKAVRILVTAIHHQNPKMAAVAGGILVKNDQCNFFTKMQSFDYTLSITSIKNMQACFQSTLVAQGAFSIFHTETVKEIGGWDNFLGEDIILTWKLLKEKRLVSFEPRAVGFTQVPENLPTFLVQRSRWARGMIEGLKLIKPWKQGSIYAKYLTFINLLIPIIDICYLIFFIPGILLSFFRLFYLVGPFTLSVLPILISNYYLMYALEKKNVLEPLKIKLNFSLLDFFIYLLVYQTLISFASFWGYCQELFHVKKVWKEPLSRKN